MAAKIMMAQKSHCQEITKVLTHAFQEFKHKYTEPAFNATVITPQQVETRMNEGQIWVAFIGTRLVGTVGGINKHEDYYIRGMAVIPEARGQQIGLLLLKELETFAMSKHYKNLILTTTPYLKRAIELYENFGFTIINDPPYEIFGTPAFKMQKPL
jgi:ribosomal protein S18 acetylase RimI-like enzyme